MRKRIFSFYDKLIVATLIGLLGLMGCSRKTYTEKQNRQQKSSLDSIQKTDSLKKNKIIFDDRPIAMYGVRPTEMPD